MHDDDSTHSARLPVSHHVARTVQVRLLYNTVGVIIHYTKAWRWKVERVAKKKKKKKEEKKKSMLCSTVCHMPYAICHLPYAISCKYTRDCMDALVWLLSSAANWNQIELIFFFGVALEIEQYRFSTTWLDELNWTGLDWTGLNLRSPLLWNGVERNGTKRNETKRNGMETTQEHSAASSTAQKNDNTMLYCNNNSRPPPPPPPGRSAAQHFIASASAMIRCSRQQTSDTPPIAIFFSHLMIVLCRILLINCYINSLHLFIKYTNRALFCSYSIFDRPTIRHHSTLILNNFNTNVRQKRILIDRSRIDIITS